MGGIYVLVGIGALIFKYIESGSIRTPRPGHGDNSALQREIDRLKNTVSEIVVRSDDGKSVDAKEIDELLKEKIRFSLDYELKDYIVNKFGSNAIRITQLKEIDTQISDLQTGVNVQIG
jgi:hypothetical protein